MKPSESAIVEASAALLPESERESARAFFSRWSDRFTPVYYRFSTSAPVSSDAVPDTLILPFAFDRYLIHDVPTLERFASLRFFCVPQEENDRWVLARHEMFCGAQDDPESNLLFLRKADGGVYFQPAPRVDEQKRPASGRAFRVAESFADFCRASRNDEPQAASSVSVSGQEPVFSEEAQNILRSCFCHEPFEEAFREWKTLIDRLEGDEKCFGADSMTTYVLTLQRESTEDSSEKLLRCRFFFALPFRPFDGVRYAYPPDRWLILGSLFLPAPPLFYGNTDQLDGNLLLDRHTGRIVLASNLLGAAHCFQMVWTNEGDVTNSHELRVFGSFRSFQMVVTDEGDVAIRPDRRKKGLSFFPSPREFFCPELAPEPCRLTAIAERWTELLERFEGREWYDPNYTSAPILRSMLQKPPTKYPSAKRFFERACSFGVTAFGFWMLFVFAVSFVSLWLVHGGDMNARPTPTEVNLTALISIPAAILLTGWLRRCARRKIYRLWRTAAESNKGEGAEY